MFVDGHSSWHKENEIAIKPEGENIAFALTESSLFLISESISAKRLFKIINSSDLNFKISQQPWNDIKNFFDVN